MTSCKCKSYIIPFTGRPGSPLFPSLLIINEVVFIHYSDIMMVAMASQITSVTIGYSTVYSGANQRKHRSFASLAFVQGIHRSPVNSQHKWPVARKMFPFDDVIMPRVAVSIVPGVISIIISIPLLNSRNVMYILFGPAKFMPDDHGLCTPGCCVLGIFLSSHFQTCIHRKKPWNILYQIFPNSRVMGPKCIADAQDRL